MTMAGMTMRWVQQQYFLCKNNYIRSLNPAPAHKTQRNRECAAPARKKLMRACSNIETGNVGSSYKPISLVLTRWWNENLGYAPRKLGGGI